MAGTDEVQIKISTDAKAAVEDLKKVENGLAGVGVSGKKASEALNNGKAVIDQYGMSAKATAAAMRNVPAQFTDIVVSLQAGQSPLTVMLQQGGQLKDMFGGVGNAAGALSSYVLGLVSPFTLAAAAAGALGFAYYKGSQDADAYNKAIIMSGNAAGVTADQLQGMAAKVAASTGASTGAAAEALAAFAANGNVGAAKMEQFAAVAVRMEQVLGVAVADTVKQFVELGKDPVKASDKLNEATHYLTEGQRLYIKSLVDRGDIEAAASEAQKTFANAENVRLDQLVAKLGTVERAWIGLVNWKNAFWSGVTDVGRPDTDAVKIAGAQSDLAKKKLSIKGMDPETSPYAKWKVETTTAEIKAMETDLKDLLDDTRAATEGAKAAAEKAAGQARTKAATSYLDDLSNAPKAAKFAAAIAKENTAYKTSVAGLATTDALYIASLKAHNERVTEINKSFEEKGAQGKAAAKTERYTVAAENSNIKYLEEQQKIELDLLESKHKNQLLSEADYRAKLAAIYTGTDDGIEIEFATSLTRLATLRENSSGDALLAADKAFTDQLAAFDKYAAAKNLRLQGSLDNEAGAIKKSGEAIRRMIAEQEANTGQIKERLAETRLKQGMNPVQVAQYDARQASEKFSDKNITAQESKVASLEKDGYTIDDAVFQDALAQLEALRVARARLSDEAAIAAGNEAAYAQSFASGWAGAYRSYADTAGNAAKTAQDAFASAANAMETAIKSFVKTGKVDFKSFGDSVINMLIDIQMQSLKTNVLAPAMGGIGEFIGKLFGTGASAASAGPSAVAAGSSGTSWLGSVPSLNAGYANGAVFSGSPSLHQYANTVQTTPKAFTFNTLHGFANGGVFAEAGPEAVMPLSRDSSGRLGVKAQGGGSAPNISLVVNNTVSDKVETSIKPRMNNGGLEIEVMIVQAVASDLRNNGPMAQGMSSTFGLARAI
ncbi:phage tail length tape measure family protein [Propionivibrio sp.]|uniref:phage tail length tape measure family protein n=1 Tax=Propionivibrio sp. TaxID=2212460 RepID=UPI003BF2D554